ncbi:hypothetical protein CHH51_08935 [Terribacillus saccharophilus]|nr:hypothetical protein CHH51_08935 [Terribacillus saccharophilus]
MYFPYVGIHRLSRSFRSLELDSKEKRRKPFRNGEGSEKARSKVIFLTQGFLASGAVPGFRSWTAPPSKNTRPKRRKACHQRHAFYIWGNKKKEDRGEGG